jgi:hypothetical protein
MLLIIEPGSLLIKQAMYTISQNEMKQILYRKTLFQPYYHAGFRLDQNTAAIATAIFFDGRAFRRFRLISFQEKDFA